MTHNRYCMHFGFLVFTTKRKSKHLTSFHIKLGTWSSHVVVLVSIVAALRSSATTRLWGRLPANQSPGCDVMCVDQQSNTPTSLFTVTETHWSSLWPSARQLHQLLHKLLPHDWLIDYLCEDERMIVCVSEDWLEPPGFHHFTRLTVIRCVQYVREAKQVYPCSTFLVVIYTEDINLKNMI